MGPLSVRILVFLLIKLKFLSMTNFKIHPQYISGFSLSDGSFSIQFNRRTNSSKLYFIPVFMITQNIDSIDVLYKIQKYFNCGSIVVNNNKNAANFVISSRKDLQSILIPHFNNYPIHGAKQQAFHIFEHIVNLLSNSKHVYQSPQEMANIIQLASLMNSSSQRTESYINGLYDFVGARPTIDSIELPIIKKHPLIEEFLVGFIDGDGSFYVSFKAKKRIEFGFNIVGSMEYLDLFNKIKTFFTCRASSIKGPKIIRYNLESKKAIRDILKPRSGVDHVLHTNKQIHYNTFKEVFHLFSDNIHKTDEGFIKLLTLAYNMNKGGRHRSCSLEEYITLYLNK